MKKALKVLAIVYLVYSAIVVTPWALRIAAFKLNNGDSVIAQLSSNNFDLFISQIGFGPYDPYASEPYDYKISKTKNPNFMTSSIYLGKESLHFDYFWGLGARENAKKIKREIETRRFEKRIRIVNGNTRWGILVANAGGSSFSKRSQQYFKKEFNPYKNIRRPATEYAIYKDYSGDYLKNLFVKHPDFFPAIWLQSLLFYLSLPVLLIIYFYSFLLAYLPTNALWLYSSIIILPLAAVFTVPFYLYRAIINRKKDKK